MACSCRPDSIGSEHENKPLWVNQMVNFSTSHLQLHLLVVMPVSHYMYTATTLRTYAGHYFVCISHSPHLWAFPSSLLLISVISGSPGLLLSVTNRGLLLISAGEKWCRLWTVVKKRHTPLNENTCPSAIQSEK